MVSLPGPGHLPGCTLLPLEPWVGVKEIMMHMDHRHVICSLGLPVSWPQQKVIAAQLHHHADATCPRDGPA